jgi:hypothetical protein
MPGETPKEDIMREKSIAIFQGKNPIAESWCNDWSFK